MVPLAAVLVEPSKEYANAEQLTPVNGTQSGEPFGSGVATIRATGGKSVTVSVTGLPPATPGILLPLESTKITLLIVKDCAVPGLFTISKETEAKIVFAVMAAGGLGERIVYATVNWPFAPC